MANTITVCAACDRASCWHGAAFCDEARDADLREATVEELRALDLEHESYWDVCPEHGVAFRECRCFRVREARR